LSILRDHLRRLRSAPVAKPAPQPSTSRAVAHQLNPPVAKTATAPVAKSKPKLPSHGAQLPVVPLTAVDVPKDAKVVLGTLLHGANPKTGRPLVMLCVPCTCPESDHCYPWRSDWPVDASMRSHQRSRCRKHKGPYGVWLAIDPGRVGRSLQVVREMREALTAWKVVQKAEKAKRAKKTVPASKETANV